MFVNLHTLPAGQHMFTIAVTGQPVGTPSEDLFYDEVDVVTGSRSTTDEILAAADLGGYEGCRIIGISDQSDGYVLWQNPASDRVV